MGTATVRAGYTALSIVFAAKSFVRREDISSGNTPYYIAGTLLNFTYSVVVGLIAMSVVVRLIAMGLFGV